MPASARHSTRSSRAAAVAVAAALGAFAPFRAGAGAPCDVDDGAFDFYARLTVAKAERCAAGNVGCCEHLDWIRGVGPADLRDVPERLATRVEKVLARLCKEGNRIACAERPEVLLRLSRDREATALWSERCLAGRPGDAADDCRHAGEGEERAGHLDRALRLYGAGCEGADGPSCRRKGSLLQARGRADEARAAFAAGCEANEAEACLEARRLSGRELPPGSWEGLYRSSTGTLWIEDLGGGRIRAEMETEWANGHSCSYGAEGAVEGERARMDAEDGDACRAELVRTAGRIDVRDPGGECRSGYCGVRGVFEESFALDRR